MNFILNLPRRLDAVTYYFTILAVGAAGIIIAFGEQYAQRGWILVLTLVFSAVSVLCFLGRVTQSRVAVQFMLAIQTLFIVVLLLLAPTSHFYLIWFYMLSVYAILTLPSRVAYGWIGFFCVLSMTMLVYLFGWSGGLATAVVYASGFAFFAAFARLTHQAQQARAESERLLGELQQAHRALQAYAAKAETLAAAEERNRLAREMHDTLGHRLTVSSVQLEAAERLIASQPERAATAVATARGQVRAALAELRQTVAALRQPLEGDLPLKRSLPRLVADFQQATGLVINLSLPQTFPSLTPPQRLTLYRTVQEGLTNVHKHAAARQVWVRLDAGADSLTLSIRDDGRGPQNHGRGFGLRGLQERALRLGGEVRFGPAPEGGSLLELTIPLKETP